MAIGDRFQLIDAQYYLGQGILNVFHYKAIAGSTPNAQYLVAGYLVSVMTPMRACQDVDMEHISITALNLDDTSDFWVEVPTSGNLGTYTGTHPLASWVALSFMYHRADRAVRNGWKRIAGIDEEVVAGNEVVSGFMTTVNALASAFASTIDVSGTQYVPVIVRKNVVPTASLDFAITGVSFRALTTQNTRKPGRGM